MDIYLMQHGPSFPKDQDPEEGLTPEGRGVVRAAAKVLKGLAVKPEVILASPKTRARQTAEASMGSAMGDLASAAMPESARTGLRTCASVNRMSRRDSSERGVDCAPR